MCVIPPWCGGGAGFLSPSPQSETGPTLASKAAFRSTAADRITARERGPRAPGRRKKQGSVQRIRKMRYGMEFSHGLLELRKPHNGDLTDCDSRGSTS